MCHCGSCSIVKASEGRYSTTDASESTHSTLAVSKFSYSAVKGSETTFLILVQLLYNCIFRFKFFCSFSHTFNLRQAIFVHRTVRIGPYLRIIVSNLILVFIMGATSLYIRIFFRFQQKALFELHNRPSQADNWYYRPTMLYILHITDTSHFSVF